jgi:CheY-like chemotaxis protein
MIVEDDDHLTEAITLLLRRRGYATKSCSDGRDALDSLRSGSAPDLILLDLLLPYMDGWEFRVEQKRDPKLASIPVIAMSVDRSAQAAAIDAHAYLQKPFDEKLLLDTIDALMRERSAARSRTKTAELDRLTSLGSLASGIAHEVNNPLTFVMGNLELAQDRAAALQARLSGPEAFSMVGVCQLLSRAQRGGERIAEVMRRVSLFARVDTDSNIGIDVLEVLESSLQLAANEIRHCARLERDLQPVSMVRGNATELGQVFLNLTLNAVRAIGEEASTDHVITVRTEMTALGEVIVTIADSGLGTSPTPGSPLFDHPRATLQRRLGLTVSEELIRAMGGKLEFESTREHGSIARVRLPALTPPPLAPSARPLPAVPAATKRAERVHVLVVDDEPLMCELILGLVGDEYDIATFTDPRAALASILDGSFDIIFCDLMMPGLSGNELYERAVKQRPELAHKFVFISGGAFTDRAREFLATTRLPQVSKPFTRMALVEAVESLLAQEAQQGTTTRAAERFTPLAPLGTSRPPA